MKKRSVILLAILLVVTLAVNIACGSLNSMITAWMGVNLNPLITGSKATGSADILSVPEATAQSLAMAESLEAEGVVLLRNENGALPLAAGSKVNLFGYASVDPIYGGTGSGSGDTSANVDVVKGLTNAGLEVNQELVKFYQNAGVSRPKQGGYTGSNFTPAEVPASAYTDALWQQAKDFSDVAIVVISRIGGEGGDLPQDMYAAGYSQTDDGRHYLELTQDEADLLALVKAQGFAKTVVLINSSNAMELGFLEDGVDAALWVGSPGAVGFNAVGRALTGEVNPSGRLVDTYAYDLSTAPAFWNAGDFTYSNLTSRHYVEYAEGIYVGYRYYETAAADGFIDYGSTVQYPFGYGLSYTSFEQSIEAYSDGGGTIAMQVKVTNTGSAAGKDAVQVYYTAPYTKGGVEKAHVVLAGFAKTKLLEPGESETVTIAFTAEDMASFDAFGAGCYVLEAGDYEIKLMRNAHELIDSRSYTVPETLVYGEGNPRSTDKTAAVAHFADVQDGQITVYVSRSDWAGTTPKTREDGKTASDAVVKAFSEKAPYEVNDADPAVVYADNGLTLEDMAGLDWNDPKWELLLQQLSDEDMATMILNGGWSTPAVASVGKPATSDLDGPAGINSLVSSLRGVSFPSEAVIGSTWNAELVEEFGRVFAAEALANGVVGLYAPGMNIHRTPFSGRNFEYYAEDGLLSGKLGAAQIRGAATQGVYCYAKHFALNDQESNRLALSVWCNEQAMRELYFKPFEITVKEGHTTAVMSSYSYLGTTWAGGSKALITDVLRGEWGFVGMVVTDSAMANTSWMDPNLAVRAGNDMMLCLMGASIDSSNNTARQAMRAACHNILYTQANSSAVQVEADNTPYWYGLVALLNAVVLSVIVLVLLKQTAFKDKKLGWVGVVTVAAILLLSALLCWFCAIKPTMKSAAPAEQTDETQPGEEQGDKQDAQPSGQGGAAPTVSPENGMELYDLADFWLGCHVNINADGTYSVAYDFGGENNGIVEDAGKWERVSDTELKLKSDGGAEIPVTLADGKWSCEVTEPNTSTVCHPSIEAGGGAAAEPAQPETVTYMVVFTDAEGVIYDAVETTDASCVPETGIPTKEGCAFAGWQTRPVVTKDDLIYGVSPYEVPIGASSLYGGAGTAITDLESLSGTMLLLYARWVEPTEIRTADELKAMADDLCGSYVLAADVDLTGENWTPVGMYFSNYETVNAPYWTYAFRGSFDGAGHTIRGLTINVDGYASRCAEYDWSRAVTRNDGEALGSDVAFFGSTARAVIRDVVFEGASVTVRSDNDATPYVAVVNGFDLSSTMTGVRVSNAAVAVTANDANMEQRQGTWAAVSAFCAGGWSTTIENCSVEASAVSLNGRLTKAHGAEYYVGGMLGEGYAFMNGNGAKAAISVDVEDACAAGEDAELVVNVGGMGGTNTTQTRGEYDTTIDLRVVKPAGRTTLSVGGLTGSQRYQIAEDNDVKAVIRSELTLDEANSRVYVGKVIGSTNVPYCIVQLIFAAPGDVAWSGCRNNRSEVTYNGEAVTLEKGETLTVGGEKLLYIANGDVTDEATGVTYAGNIDAVIAEFGSAVPASFLQKAVIVLVDG
ncbi:MAG: glycoside hydrolase family 3 C-terminal domain-containing protein [Oscillospiraceae bacterium]|nr:glycoside hydrolase family 3 C-terminal domain-containing protein [Oscillospiraceae bacterium]